MAKKLEEIKEEECPYELPEGWKWKRLGNEIVLISGQDVPSKECNEVGNGIPYVMGASNIENSKFSATRWIENPRVISLKSDILISVKGTVGKLYIQNEDVLNISRQIMAIRVKENIVNEYMFNFLVYFNDILKTSANGLIPGISRDVLLKTIIPLPPKETQQKIVDIIESLFAKLDIAQEKVEQVLAESENRRSAILHNAFNGKMTEKWREENNVSFDSWQQKILENLTVNLDSKRVPLSKNERENIDKIYDYYGASGIIDKVDKYIFDGKYLLIGEDGANLLTRNKNIAFIAEGQFWVNNHAHILKTNNIINMEYLCYYINSIDLSDYITGSAQPKLTQKKLNLILIYVPLITEQKEIVRLLDKFLSVEDKVKSTCQSTLEAIATMRKSILAKAFRGELSS